MTARLSPQREAEIAARAKAATPGPWDRYEEYGPTFFANVTGSYLQGVGDFNFGVGEQAEADESFVRHAPADVDLLLAELAAVRAERDELADRARRVAASHREFIAEHSDPGTEAISAQYELDQYLVGQRRRCPGFAPEYQGVSDAKRRLARCGHCRQDRFASIHTEEATS